MLWTEAEQEAGPKGQQVSGVTCWPLRGQEGSMAATGTVTGQQRVRRQRLTWEETQALMPEHEARTASALQKRFPQQSVSVLTMSLFSSHYQWNRNRSTFQGAHPGCGRGMQTCVQREGGWGACDGQAALNLGLGLKVLLLFHSGGYDSQAHQEPRREEGGGVAERNWEERVRRGCLARSGGPQVVGGVYFIWPQGIQEGRRVCDLRDRLWEMWALRGHAAVGLGASGSPGTRPRGWHRSWWCRYWEYPGSQGQRDWLMVGGAGRHCPGWGDLASTDLISLGTQKTSSHDLAVVVAQLPSCVRLFATPWTAAHQASPSLTVSHTLWLSCWHENEASELPHSVTPTPQMNWGHFHTCPLSGCKTLCPEPTNVQATVGSHRAGCIDSCRRKSLPAESMHEHIYSSRLPPACQWV